MIPDGYESADQLETYASDLNRTYGELRRHLHQLTVLHEVNTRIASALDPDEVLAGMLGSLSQLLTYQTAVIYLMDLDVAAPAEGQHTVVPVDVAPPARRARVRSGSAPRGGGVPRRGGQHGCRVHARSAHDRADDLAWRPAAGGTVALGRALAGGTRAAARRSVARRGRESCRAARRRGRGRPAERPPLSGNAAPGHNRRADRLEQLPSFPRPAQPRGAAGATHGLPDRAHHHGPRPLQAGQRSPWPPDGRSGAASGGRAVAQASAPHRRGRSARRRRVRGHPARGWPDRGSGGRRKTPTRGRGAVADSRRHVVEPHARHVEPRGHVAERGHRRRGAPGELRRSGALRGQAQRTQPGAPLGLGPPVDRASAGACTRATERLNPWRAPPSGGSWSPTTTMGCGV